MGRLKIISSLVILAVPISYGFWTYYENTSGSCAVDVVPDGVATPSGGTLSRTASRAIAAYGGDSIWRHATTVESTVTIGGALFWIKGQRIPAHAIIRTDIKRPRVEINPIDAEGDVGILDGFSLTLKSRNGQILDERRDARDHLRSQQLWTRWDRLDLLYFLGYAFWGYNSLPFQLTRSDIKWTELKDGVLQADYGLDLPVHSRVQRFYFDPQTALLKRNDYTAVAASPGANAANVVLTHQKFNDVPYPSQRRVKMTPQRYGTCLPAPNMVTIDVEQWRIY